MTHHLVSQPQRARIVAGLGRLAGLSLVLALSGLPVLADPADAGITQTLAALANVAAPPDATESVARSLLSGDAFTAWQQGTSWEWVGPPEAIRIVDADHAVARVTNRRSPPFETYLHLTHTDSWRVSTVSITAGVGMADAMLRELKAKPSPNADEQAIVTSIRLWRSRDRDLRVWFEARRPAFADLVRDFRSGSLESSKVRERCRALETLTVTKLAGEDMIPSSQRTTAAVWVYIGGELDDSVGLIHDPAGLGPVVTPEHYIWAEPLGDGWFLARTA